MAVRSADRALAVLSPAFTERVRADLSDAGGQLERLLGLPLIVAGPGSRAGRVKARR